MLGSEIMFVTLEETFSAETAPDTRVGEIGSPVLIKEAVVREGMVLCT